MLVFVHAVKPNAEEWVRQVARNSGIREVEVDDERCKSSKRWGPTEVSAAAVGVSRPDDSIVIGIPVFAVLLDDRLMLVCRCPTVLRGAIRFLPRRGDGCSRRACVFKIRVWGRHVWLSLFSHRGFVNVRLEGC